MLTLLALLAPALTLAPTQATEPLGGAGDSAAPREGVSRGPLAWLAAGDVVTRWPTTETASRPVPRTGPPPRPTAASTVPDTARFQAALDTARAAGRAHGVTFAVVRDGTLVWAGASGNERDGATPMTADAELVIGSVTKTFVAATVLQLVAEGRLALEDPAREHLGEIGRLDAEITVAQLLDHTSGLADLFNETTRLGLEEDPGHAWTPDEVLATLHAPWYAPGDGWAYANTNYYLLGLLVERITGGSLADELDRRFLAPLGLERTTMLPADDSEGLLAPAWTTIFWASGAMTSSAADLARWGDALYAGSVLDAASRGRMLTVNDHDYGLGAQRIEIGDAEGFGHTGLLNTYTTLLLHVPEHDATIALLVNRSEVDLGAMLSAEPARGPSLLELALGD